MTEKIATQSCCMLGNEEHARKLELRAVMAGNRDRVVFIQRLCSP